MLAQSTGCWLCKYVESKSYRVTEASTQVSKEGLGGLEICGRFKIPAGSPERAMYKAVRVKLKPQWTPWDGKR
jgi:hypothetical protein